MVRGCEILTTARKASGFTQNETIAIYGAPCIRTYRDWEKGDKPIPYDDLVGIVEQVFNYSIDAIKELVNANRKRNQKC